MANANYPEEGMTPFARPDESDFGVAVGSDMALPFAESYNPGYSTITQATPHDTGLYEVSSENQLEGGPSIWDLELMRRKDGQASALHKLLTMPIRSALAKSDIKPDEGGEEQAEFIRQCLYTSANNGGMQTPLRRVMAQLLEALFLGFSAFEKVYWIPQTGPLKGKITLKKLSYRPTTTITFITNSTGEFAGMRQRIWSGPSYRDVFIEPKYCVYFAAQEELRKFYGVSYFQSAYYHWDKKSKLEYVSHLAAQRSAVGTRIGTMPTGASVTLKREFSHALASMALSQYLAIPEGFEVEVLKEGGSFDFAQLIDYHNSQMSKSILANFFDKDQSAGKGGSMVSFGEPGNEMFILMLRTIMDDIADVINLFVIPQLIDLNFTGAKRLYPTFSWGDLTNDQEVAVAEMFKTMATAGQSLATTPEFMRALEEHAADMMGLDIDYEAVDAREEEEQALADAQFAQAQGAEGMVGPDGLPIPEATEPTPEELDASLAELEKSFATESADEPTDTGKPAPKKKTEAK